MELVKKDSKTKDKQGELNYSELNAPMFTVKYRDGSQVIHGLGGLVIIEAQAPYEVGTSMPLRTNESNDEDGHENKDR